MYPNPAERNFITLLCAMDASHDHIVKYFMLPRMSCFKPACDHDSCFARGHGLDTYQSSIALR